MNPLFVVCIVANYEINRKENTTHPMIYQYTMGFRTRILSLPISEDSSNS